ncbi:hypothetical protein BaRGS_00018125 [Batillaria attramentaria]|uniref:Uncharacterized protein n=1 Tax=Batillaria attramentaria TaxID=370345 RepID=A0ABD0KUG2_9CAEN
MINFSTSDNSLQAEKQAPCRLRDASAGPSQLRGVPQHDMGRVRLSGGIPPPLGTLTASVRQQHVDRGRTGLHCGQ